MPSSTILNTLKINKLSEAQFDAAVQQGVIGANDLSLLIDADNQSIQVDTLPTAEVSELGNIYQFVGATDQNYTNGYFYKCVSDGASTPTYSWTQVSVQPAGSSLPDQTGNAGKFLTTDGTDASWGNTVRNVTFNTSNGSNVFNETFYKKSTNDERFVISYGSSVDINTHLGWSFGKDPFDSTKHIFFYENNAGGASYTAHPIIGKSNRKFENLYITTVNNGSDITVPSVGGTLALQIATLPTADSTYEGTIYQYTGATDANYTHGYLYECVSDGGNPATYSWTRVDVQPTPTAPTVDQTYNPSSTNAQSGTAVAGAISSAISSVYRAAGSVTFANLPNLSSSIEGYVYDISDSFTTTADFVEGAGNTYSAGTNVVCINTAASGQTAVYKWDVLSALADLSGYLPLTGGTVNGTITIKNDASGHYTPSSSHIKMYAPYGGSDGTAVELQTRNSGVLDVIGSIYEHGDILAAGGSNNLGSTLLPWTKIYVKEIGNANGTSISVPDNVTSSIMAVQMSTVPTATAKNDGQVVQYVGTTDSNYINGYFYKSTTTAPDTATITQTVGSSLSNLAVDASTFVLRRGAGTFTYIYNGSAWVSGGVAYVLNSHGITYTGTPVENDEITVVAQAGTHVWSQVNVQPGSSLPSQTGNAGKFLTTDGTNASWGEALVNTATGSNSLTILGTASTRSGDIVIGTNAIGSSSSGSDSVVIGRSANYGGAGGNESVALGALTRATGRGSISIGRSTFSTGTNSIAMGYSSRASGNNAIQFGTDGTQSITDNTDANTFKVANANGNFEIMSADGTIPTDRFTTTPSTDGNYVPTLSISSGTATRSWTSIASSVSSSSTNAETVGAKLFYDTVGDIVTLINAL